MRTRLALAGAWILGTVVTSGLAWAAVNRVETRLTTSDAVIVSPKGVDRAVAPLAVSSTTEWRPEGAAMSTATTAPVTPTISPAPDGPSRPGATSTTAETSSPATSVPPEAAPVSTVTTPPTTAPPTTNAARPTVIPTAGGTVAVACPTANTIRLEYATPNPGYLYSPVEITAQHVHVKFAKDGQTIVIEAECSHGRVEVSTEDDD